MSEVIPVFQARSAGRNNLLHNIMTACHQILSLNGMDTRQMLSWSLISRKPQNICGYGRSSDLSQPSTPSRYLSGFFPMVFAGITAAGLSGICTRFPFHRTRRHQNHCKNNEIFPINAQNRRNIFHQGPTKFDSLLKNFNYSKKIGTMYCKVLNLFLTLRHD